jgi:hypothetical protein
MAKKNSRSDNSASPTRQPPPERRRTARAATRNTETTPDAISAEPDGSAAVAHETANDRPHDGSGSTTTHTPTYEQIAEAAYHRYLARGGQHGRDFDDWLDAERSLRERP